MSWPEALLHIQRGNPLDGIQRVHCKCLAKPCRPAGDKVDGKGRLNERGGSCRRVTQRTTESRQTFAEPGKKGNSRWKMTITLPGGPALLMAALKRVKE
jgi:hypothetical protein